MDYSCLRCGRIFSYREMVSFCPFCGQAYHTSAMSTYAESDDRGEKDIRISIGADSEKTIQEKYWKLTQGSLNTAINLLDYSLPRFSLEQEEAEDGEVETPEEYRTIILDVRKFMSLKNSTSFVMFRNKLESYIEDMEMVFRKSCAILKLANQNAEAYQKEIVARKLAFELGEWSIEEFEDECSVKIEEEEEFIHNFCMDVAEALGNMWPDRLCPELGFDPEGIDWQAELENCKPNAFDDLNQAHIELIHLIREVMPSVVRVVQDNGMFILSAMNRSVDEEFKPQMHADRLRTLVAANYDPLFGDPPEEFIEAFSKAVANMTAYLNKLPSYEYVTENTPEKLLEKMKQRLDEIKMDALESLIQKWSDVLQQELDRLYQRQSENMLDVYNSIEQMKQKLDDE